MDTNESIESEYKHVTDVLKKLYKDRQTLERERTGLINSINFAENRLAELAIACDDIDHLNECMKINNI